MPTDMSTAATDGLSALDGFWRSLLAGATQGLSPVATAKAWLDWASNLSMSPGHQARLALAAAEASAGVASRALVPAARGGTGDRRFPDPHWGRYPYSLLSETFLAAERWWDLAAEMPGASRRSNQLVRFNVQQALQALSPAHWPATNPEFLSRTWQERGANLARGLDLLARDTARQLAHAQAETGFRVGETLAVTPGQVVFRNELLELIQYAPETETVQPEPVLVVPAWIMKYYILDLRPENSLVRYLVGRGHTVYAISWRNPTREQADVGFDDYRRDGVMAALDAISAIQPGAKVHAAGYCLGGTLLTVAAAAMARDGDDRLAGMTLLAAQADFTEAGELLTFIDDDEVGWLDNLMAAEGGVLDGSRMGGAFQLLRAEELLWAPLLKRYLMGEEDRSSDLMAWNADQTRMPHRMHSEYLRGMFLRNDLAQGRFKADGRPVAVADIKVPIFAVGTVKDHVAPWVSVHKIHLLARSEVTFCLTAGGHNAGIVSEPGHAHRSYRIRTQAPGDRYLPPEEWAAKAPALEGSWWVAWARWLGDRSGAPVPPPPMGCEALPPLCPAPGTYVHQH